MLIIITIFVITTLLVLGMLFYRAWEIRENKIEESISIHKIIPEIYFRQIEKIMLYLTKHIIQWIVLNLVKYWFIISTKTKKWIGKNLPRVHNLFKKKQNENGLQKTSFIRRAVIESKIKIRRIKEKVKNDHEESNNL